VKKASPMIGFPLLLIPLAIYNIVAWLMPTVSMVDPLIKVTLVSGTEWAVNLSDILLALGLLLLLLEIVKGARPGSKYLTDHLLSLIVFGAAAAEFVMWPKFGTSTFFLLTLMAMVDFFGGIALHARRTAVPATVSRRNRGSNPCPRHRRRPPIRRHQCRQRPRSPSRCCLIIRSRFSPQPNRRRPSRLRNCSPAPAPRPRPRRRGSNAVLDGLPRAQAGVPDLVHVRGIGGKRISRRRASPLAGLRRVLGGRNQLRDEIGVGPRHRQFGGATSGLRDRHQRGAGGLNVLEDAVFYFHFVNAGHCKPSHSGTSGPATV
jgi:hypothetical protein